MEHYKRKERHPDLVKFRRAKIATGNASPKTGTKLLKRLEELEARLNKLEA